jgi:hypothetical protein
MGEDENGAFAFDTYAGKVVLEATTDQMTPFGGIVPFAAFLKHSGVLQRLAESSPVRYTSPNASRLHDIIASFMLTVLCDGSRFSHVERLRHDPALPEVMGMESVVCDGPSAAIWRLFRRPMAVCGPPVPPRRCGARCRGTSSWTGTAQC